MAIVRILATPDLAQAQAAHDGITRLGVALFHAGDPALPGLGSNLPMQFRHGLPRPVPQLAWDFLSIALAAFAADRFVLRAAGEDGWTRVIDLSVAVHDPTTWNPVANRLETALRFLTGDIWNLRFVPGGAEPLAFQGDLLHDRDAVCLFSGGLDSLLGALMLLDQGRKPKLVSQASPKEVSPQKVLAHQIGLADHRLNANVFERWRPPYEPSTRGRSLIFFAYGVATAAALDLPEIAVPENGLIAINPPLTPRRLGSLSTRTTHPHLLAELNGIFADVGLNVRLVNPFEGLTKGEMLAKAKHPKLSMLAGASYSCGKGKRKNGQCGRCVPCLIRRASFNAAGIKDETKKYVDVIEASKRNDDVMAARLAVAKASRMDADQFERWVRQAGPLPDDPVRRAAIVRAVKGGIGELSAYLGSIRWR